MNRASRELALHHGFLTPRWFSRGNEIPDAGELGVELESWNRGESDDLHAAPMVGRAPLALFESETAQTARPLSMTC